MMTATDHPMVRDYLARLREESQDGSPVDQARELESPTSTEHLARPQSRLKTRPRSPVRDALGPSRYGPG